MITLFACIGCFVAGLFVGLHPEVVKDAARRATDSISAKLKK